MVGDKINIISLAEHFQCAPKNIIRTAAGRAVAQVGKKPRNFDDAHATVKGFDDAQRALWRSGHHGGVPAMPGEDAGEVEIAEVSGARAPVMVQKKDGFFAVIGVWLGVGHAAKEVEIIGDYSLPAKRCLTLMNGVRL